MNLVLLTITSESILCSTCVCWYVTTTTPFIIYITIIKISMSTVTIDVVQIARNGTAAKSMVIKYCTPYLVTCLMNHDG